MKKFLNRFVALLLCSSVLQIQAETIKLADNAPNEYVVVKGDTLWDISARFLQSPWLWPKVWEANAQIFNPHLIYPGDVIYLYWQNGEPRLGIKQPSGPTGTVVLTPEVKVIPRKEAIQTIPLRDLRAFLHDNQVVSQDLLDNAPYILGGKNQRILAANGDRVYARGTLVGDEKLQAIYRPSKTYKDPHTGEELGFELHRVADVVVRGFESETIKLDVANAVEEVRIKDQVIPSEESALNTRFTPKAGPDLENVEIIAVHNGVANIGQFDTLTVNAGLREGVSVGDVFAIFNRGEKIRDPKTGETLRLPSERAGELMVFKAFEKVSYAIVMRAHEVIKLGDELHTP